MEPDLLDSPQSTQPRRKKGVFLLVLICIQLLAYALSVVFAFAEIRTILISGPIVLFIGILVFILGLVFRNILGALIGGAVAFSVLALFGIIFLMNLGPRDAEEIIPLIAGVTWLGLLLMSISFFTRASTSSKVDK